MSQLGIGVMLEMLTGNQSTVDAVNLSLGKKITSLRIDKNSNELIVRFEDKTRLSLWDNGQSCCEHRYMSTDDKVSDYSSATLKNIEIVDASPQSDEHGEEHEIQFLRLITDKGIFVVSNHNEHNGYYGGFSLQARLE